MGANPLIKIRLVLLAAGSSTRMGGGKKKEYRPLNGSAPQDSEKEAYSAFFASPSIKNLIKDTHLSFIKGGSTRQESVFRALSFLETIEASAPFSDSLKDIVIIHDAARPFVSSKIITECIRVSKEYGAAVPGIQPVDTQKEIKEVQDGYIIQRHLERSSLVAIQTPQVFERYSIFNCHKKAISSPIVYTDDSEIWDSFPEITNNRKVYVIQGDVTNKKITFESDMRTEQLQLPITRIGFGTDLHKLVSGRKFYLGGVEIPAEKGELGHSDGDVLLHAISDALLGASALGDIGSYFPPEDAKWKDARSADLLRTIWLDVKKAGWHLGNLDCVVECEAPKLLKWRDTIIQSISSILDTEPGIIFVKAKTNEKVDAVGEERAIKAYCVCNLIKD